MSKSIVPSTSAQALQLHAVFKEEFLVQIAKMIQADERRRGQDSMKEKSDALLAKLMVILPDNEDASIVLVAAINTLMNALEGTSNSLFATVSSN